MTRDGERIERIRRTLSAANMDAIICALPTNVLLLSGYCPIVGTSLAMATQDGRIELIVPEDEQELAVKGWADEVRAFKAGSLAEMRSIYESVCAPLAGAAKSLELGSGCVLGYESGEAYEPATYASIHLYGAGIVELLNKALPSVALAPAGDLLAPLRSIKTAYEVERVRVACDIAEAAFTEGAWKLRAGLTEAEAAAQFRTFLSTKGTARDGVERADGFFYCMSGANAAKAYAAYQRSRAKVIAPRDFALVHCNSYVDGYWTDITRTFCIGEMDERQRRMYAAVFEARRAALDAIRPTVKACEVDEAAREVIRQHGFGEQFKHPTGHGVGFAAINHHASPRLHPVSNETLERGMVFNVEPAIYIKGFGGLRHCDMVVVTDEGAEVLTPFLSSVEELMIA